MAKDLRWVDDTWWRDWVFWFGVVAATANATLADVLGSGVWWSVALRWFLAFGATVAVCGFVRVVVRTYREPGVRTG